jgi:hypothetical protein
MPIPSLLKRTFQEGLEKGLEKGRDAEREGILAGMLRHRFGSDDRIPAVARQLAALELDDVLDRLDKAATLDDLVTD